MVAEALEVPEEGAEDVGVLAAKNRYIFESDYVIYLYFKI